MILCLLILLYIVSSKYRDTQNTAQVPSLLNRKGLVSWDENIHMKTSKSKFTKQDIKISVFSPLDACDLVSNSEPRKKRVS